MASKEFNDLEFLLFGDEAKIRKALGDQYAEGGKITIVHTTEKIESDDEPVKAIRRKNKLRWCLLLKQSRTRRPTLYFRQGIPVRFWQPDY